MRNLFTDTKGVTLLEGLIALLLLAVVAVGTFSVLLSVSRQPAQPDIQEEMLFAVERANNLLQLYTYFLGTSDDNSPHTNTRIINQLQHYFGTTPLSVGVHNSTNLRKLLPVICDRDDTNNSPSTLTYTVTREDVNLDVKTAVGLGESESDAYLTTGAWNDNVYSYTAANIPVVKVEFNITCNGYTL